MERIESVQHSTSTFTFGLSRLFERAAYYGIRGIIVLYMVGETMNMPQEKVLMIYGWFTAAFTFSKIFGALFGDLLIGNRRAMHIGALIMMFGMFSLCINSEIGLYIGLGLIILGSGFYEPNLLANYAKSYLNKSQLMDSAFSILYIGVNLGALVGVFFIGYIGEKFGWNWSFLLGGSLMLFSLAFAYFTERQSEINFPKKTISLDKRIIQMIYAILIVGLFWAVYELSYYAKIDIQTALESTIESLTANLWQMTDSAFLMPIGIIAAILWTFFYSRPFAKLGIGFLFGTLSIGSLFLIPENPTEHHLIIYAISAFFLAIAEMHIAPIIYSIVAINCHPGFLAIAFSLIYIPVTVFNKLIGLFSEDLMTNPSLSLNISLIIFTAITISLMIYLYSSKQKKSLQTNEKS